MRTHMWCAKGICMDPLPEQATGPRWSTKNRYASGIVTTGHQIWCANSKLVTISLFLLVILWPSFYKATDLTKHDILMPGKAPMLKSWAMSLSGVLTPPVPTDKAVQHDIFHHMWNNSSNNWGDPRCSYDSEYWPSLPREEREVTLRFTGEHPLS
jgi:hypothetical protein